jgi:hypothetical protein
MEQLLDSLDICVERQDHTPVDFSMIERASVWCHFLSIVTLGRKKAVVLLW